MPEIHNENKQQSLQLQAQNGQDLRSSLQEHQHQDLQLASSPHNLPGPSSSSSTTPSMSTLQDMKIQHQQHLQLASSPHNLPGPTSSSSTTSSMSTLQNIETQQQQQLQPVSSPQNLPGPPLSSSDITSMSTLEKTETANIPELASSSHNLPGPSLSSSATPFMSTLQNIETQQQQQLQPVSSPQNLSGPPSSSSATPSMSTLENIETANIPELASSSHNLPGPSSSSSATPTLQNIETQHQQQLQPVISPQNLPGPPLSSSDTTSMSTLEKTETSNIPELASSSHNLPCASLSSSATPSMSTLQTIETQQQQQLQPVSSPQNLPGPPLSSSDITSMSTLEKTETASIPELASSSHNLPSPSSSSSATPTLQNIETQQQQLQPVSSPQNLSGPPSSSSATPSMSTLENTETANIPELASSSHNLPGPSSSSSASPSMSTLQNIETQQQQQLQPVSSPQNLPGPPLSSSATPSMSTLKKTETTNIPELASNYHNLPSPSSSSSATPSMSTLQNIETQQQQQLQPVSSPQNLPGPPSSSSTTPSMSTRQNIETQRQQQLQPVSSPQNLPGPPSSSSATPSMNTLENTETTNIPELASSSHNLPGPSSSSSTIPSMSTLQNIDTANIPALESSPRSLPGPSSISSATPCMSTLQNIETANISVKLTSQNYHLWKSLVLPVLQKYNLGGIIDGTERCPPQYLTTDEGRRTETLNPAYSSWIDRDRQLLMWLKSTLSEKLLPYGVSVSNSRDLWIELEKRFKVSSNSPIFQLQVRLRTLKKDNSMSIATYLRIAKQYADELAAVGAPVARSDLIDHILQGLPEQYNTFTTSIRTNLLEVTVEKLEDLLLSEEKDIPIRALATLSSYANSNNILPIKTIREIMISSLLDLLSDAEVAVSNSNPKVCFGKNDIATEIEILRNNLIDIRQAFMVSECFEKSVNALYQKISVNALFKKFLQPQHTLHQLLLRPGQTKIHDLPAKQFQLRTRLLNQMVIKLKEMIPLLQKSSSSQLARTECSKLSYELPHLHFSKVFQDSQAFKDFRVVYDSLDVTTKLCLLCFAAIPANEVIKKRLLVHWWVGEGFFNPPVDDEKKVEEIGDGIFEELTKKGCIEPVKKKQRSDVHSFKMHPIIHSAVIFLAEDAGFLDFDDKGNPTINFSWSYRACLVNGSSHLNKIFMSTSDLYRENELRPSDLDPRKLQTIFNVNESYPDFSKVDWSKLKNLKVLYLGRWHSKATHHIEIDDIDFLNGLGFMRQLIFLSLRGISRIVKLPDSVCKLVNLRILDLSACNNLEVLPEKIASLKKLTHLDISDCYLLEHMPKGIASLTELQVLKGFITGDDKNDTSCTLQDLSVLHKLRKLTINTSREDFPGEEELTVFQKFGSLQNLTILWGWLPFTATQINIAQDNVAEKPSETSNLKGNAGNKKQHNDAANPPEGSSKKRKSWLGPPQVSNQEIQKPFEGLKKLDLQGYPQKTAPSWLRPAQLKSLEKLYIRGGQLQGLHEKDKWKVKILRLKFLSELRMDWNDLLVLFPDLIYIEKFRCPKLTFFPCNENGVWLKPEN